MNTLATLTPSNYPWETATESARASSRFPRRHFSCDQPEEMALALGPTGTFWRWPPRHVVRPLWNTLTREQLAEVPNDARSFCLF